MEIQLLRRLDFFCFKIFMFSELDIIVRIRRIGEMLKGDSIWFEAIDQNIKDMIIQMNTEDQLEEQGIDSLGRLLGDYAPFTIQEKIEKGQRYDHITLKDTGAFYDSWIVSVNSDAILIDADDTSLYDEPLFTVWGEDVLGLTEENLVHLQSAIIERYIEIILNELLR